MKTTTLHKTLAKNIRQYRLDLGISQESLSELVNVHRNTISLLETGKRGISLELLIELARIFNCKPYELLMPKA